MTEKLNQTIVQLVQKELADYHSKQLAVSYTHLRAHETDSYLVCRLLLEKKKRNKNKNYKKNIKKKKDIV